MDKVCVKWNKSVVKSEIKFAPRYIKVGITLEDVSFPRHNMKI